MFSRQWRMVVARFHLYNTRSRRRNRPRPSFCERAGIEPARVRRRGLAVSFRYAAIISLSSLSSSHTSSFLFTLMPPLSACGRRTSDSFTLNVIVFCRLVHTVPRRNMVQCAISFGETMLLNGSIIPSNSADRGRVDVGYASNTPPPRSLMDAM